MPRATKLGLSDLSKVTPDEAVELMAHHLKLAALYFEAVPDDIEAVKTECKRLLTDEDLVHTNYRDPAIDGMEGFVASMHDHYQLLDKELTPK